MNDQIAKNAVRYGGALFMLEVAKSSPHVPRDTAVHAFNLLKMKRSAVSFPRWCAAVLPHSSVADLQEVIQRTGAVLQQMCKTQCDPVDFNEKIARSDSIARAVPLAPQASQRAAIHQIRWRVEHGQMACAGLADYLAYSDYRRAQEAGVDIAALLSELREGFNGEDWSDGGSEGAREKAKNGADGSAASAASSASSASATSAASAASEGAKGSHDPAQGSQQPAKTLPPSSRLFSLFGDGEAISLEKLEELIATGSRLAGHTPTSVIYISGLKAVPRLLSEIVEIFSKFGEICGAATDFHGSSAIVEYTCVESAAVALCFAHSADEAKSPECQGLPQLLMSFKLPPGAKVGILLSPDGPGAEDARGQHPSPHSPQKARAKATRPVPASPSGRTPNSPPPEAAMLSQDAFELIRNVIVIRCSRVASAAPASAGEPGGKLAPAPDTDAAPNSKTADLIVKAILASEFIIPTTIQSCNRVRGPVPYCLAIKFNSGALAGAFRTKFSHSQLREEIGVSAEFLREPIPPGCMEPIVLAPRPGPAVSGPAATGSAAPATKAVDSRESKAALDAKEASDTRIPPPPGSVRFSDAPASEGATGSPGAPGAPEVTTASNASNASGASGPPGASSSPNAPNALDVTSSTAFLALPPGKEYRDLVTMGLLFINKVKSIRACTLRGGSSGVALQFFSDSILNAFRAKLQDSEKARAAGFLLSPAPEDAGAIGEVLYPSHAHPAAGNPRPHLRPAPPQSEPAKPAKPVRRNWESLDSSGEAGDHPPPAARGRHGSSAAPTGTLKR